MSGSGFIRLDLPERAGYNPDVARREVLRESGRRLQKEKTG